MDPKNYGSIYPSNDNNKNPKQTNKQKQNLQEDIMRQNVITQFGNRPGHCG